MLTFSVSTLLVEVVKVLLEEDTKSLAGSERDLQKPGSRCGKRDIKLLPLQYCAVLCNALSCQVTNVSTDEPSIRCLERQHYCLKSIMEITQQGQDQEIVKNIIITRVGDATDH